MSRSNVTNSNVIDVGYAGVIGADRVVDGTPLYGKFPSDNASGDTYGPVVYDAYVPFEQALPWSGRWDDLPAAHAAAITFDLLAVALCFLIGRRVRGPDLGVLLAYAWTTYPFTLYALMSNSNDALVAVLVLAAVWAAGSAPARGALVALAGLTKFAPLALAPLFALHPYPRLRTFAAFAAGFVLAAVLAFAPLLGNLDLREFWDHTIAFQAQRGSPFSIWGLYDPDVAWLDVAQRAAQIAGALLAVALAFVPRRRDIVGLAACSAAILIALQMGVSHWFYLYIPWFFGLVMIALLGRWGAPERSTAIRSVGRLGSSGSWRKGTVWPNKAHMSLERRSYAPGAAGASPCCQLLLLPRYSRSPPHVLPRRLLAEIVCTTRRRSSRSA